MHRVITQVLTLTVLVYNIKIYTILVRLLCAFQQLQSAVAGNMHVLVSIL